MVTKKFREKRELRSCCYKTTMRCIWQLNWETSDADEGFREPDQPTQQHTRVRIAAVQRRQREWEEKVRGEQRGGRIEEGVNRRLPLSATATVTFPRICYADADCKSTTLQQRNTFLRPICSKYYALLEVCHTGTVSVQTFSNEFKNS